MRPLSNAATSRVRLRTGRDLTVCDMSSGGARVAGAVRLLPGTHADVHVVGAGGRQLVRSRIVWVRVLTVTPLVYEAALLFDAEVVLLAGGYRVPAASAGSVGSAGPAYPPRGTDRPVSPE